nr:PsiF family protein [Hyphomicrobium sp. 99]
MGAGTAFAAAEKSAASMECSKQADAKGLHGKDRKKFREHCKHEMMHSKEAKPEEKK